MTIRTSFTLETLKLNLHKKLGLSDNVVVGRMAYCIPHAVDVGKWQLVDVDDDIAFIFDMHAVSGGFRTMYLYMEPKMGENSAPRVQETHLRPAPATFEAPSPSTPAT
ncbi:hypothetical protein PIB30_062261, partial [Stylosanthes scabra]|nr:hypothetical protein [Stylosanthes scabra]